VTPFQDGDARGDDPNEYTWDKDRWYPFNPVPDVRQFEVELNAFDPIFAMFGLRKRFSPHFKFSKYGNKKYNKYMDHQLQRLEYARIGRIAVRSDFKSKKEFLRKTYRRTEKLFSTGFRPKFIG